MNLNKKDIIELRTKYNNAVVEKLDSFIFRGQEILTKYAKYLLEYIDNQNK